MNQILISSCLLGMPVRYHGKAASCDHPILARWLAEGRIISVCPEVAGGLPTPRPPAEIGSGKGGLLVLQGNAQVIDAEGQDVSLEFVAGAQQALELAQAKNIKVAVLKEGSPSCGSGFTYDGSFSGQRVTQAGVTAACLKEAGIRVFSELQLEQAAEYLELLDREA
jgi:uncharacterized protein YbbK (DUF523 family)